MNNKNDLSILQGAYSRYRRSSAFSLFDCYGKFSQAKYLAYEHCYQAMHDLNGYNFRIISFNTSVFTVGFKYLDNGVEYFVYITPTYNRVAPVTDLI